MIFTCKKLDNVSLCLCVNSCVHFVCIISMTCLTVLDYCHTICTHNILKCIQNRIVKVILMRNTHVDIYLIFLLCQIRIYIQVNTIVLQLEIEWKLK